MYREILTLIILTRSAYVSGVFISAETNAPALPFCEAKNNTGLVFVSTLDGKLSAINPEGNIHWEIETNPGPLLVSNIHNLELTNNGEWIRMIPSLTGTLYRFDGVTVDPISISAENLLKSSFKYSENVVIAGGIDVRTYGVGLRSGKKLYECTKKKCSNEEQKDMDDLLLIERTTQTVRAVESRSGSERWNFSVGIHNIKLPQVSCMEQKAFIWNVSAIIPEGILLNVAEDGSGDFSWQVNFNAPIVRVWTWNGISISEVNLFNSQNVPTLVSSTSIGSPTLYIGMHNKQLYIQESVEMQNILKQQQITDLIVTESFSVAKIPWKPVPASYEKTEDDSTALSVLNNSEYVNGNGYYLYLEESPKNSPSFYNTNSNYILKGEGVSIGEDAYQNYSLIYLCKTYYLELALFLLLGPFLIKIWYNNNFKQVIVIEKEAQNKTQPEVILSAHQKETFKSRYTDDFETIRCLGKGGFGIVFQVKQNIDECHYAIKRIPLPDESVSRDRVMREVKALAKLEHKNIVRYFCSWVEHPPLGWEHKHDTKWLSETEITYEETTSKLKRTKSCSINIEIHTNSSDSSSEISENNSRLYSENDDDSYIVFVNSNDNEAVETKTNNNSSDHISKKINWKKPGRKHHSLDLSETSNIKTRTVKQSRVYLYIQMQLCQKESLRDWLQLEKERDYNNVLYIFAQILDAVEYVHLSGLIHRDLKPSNIFFSLEGQVKVGDFGLVKDTVGYEGTDSTQHYKNGLSFYRGHTRDVGTHLYMSPEQFRSSIYNHKVDIYALGVIFFELLVPFVTDMERIKSLTNIKLHKYPKGFSEKYPCEYALIQNMLEADPNKRLSIGCIKSRKPFVDNSA